MVDRLVLNLIHSARTGRTGGSVFRNQAGLEPLSFAEGQYLGGISAQLRTISEYLVNTNAFLK